MRRSLKTGAISLGVMLGVATVWAQAPPHIQAVQEFLLGWGKGNWEAMKAQAGDKVTIKVGGTEYSLDVEAKKADAQLVLPFRGLSSIRENGRLTGVAVDQVTVTAGGQEKTGKATVTLAEKDGGFRVTGVNLE